MDFELGRYHPDYPVIFVTESETDPAHAAIRRRLGNDPRGRRVVAGKSERTGRKVHNQLADFRLLGGADRIVAFADGDLSGRKGAGISYRITGSQETAIVSRL